ncbi:YitT family protein [Sphaerotilus sp.]|uniref:YitT family protein n=1 Tax=Sphaerotilus sp. TaxID=2093942 RepID=UPI002ACD2777|nr:YitT family protein [Sphaerotilus sp.]MDZ7855383.1 YitT family protein [Sphaerotilus sp.]
MTSPSTATPSPALDDSPVIPHSLTEDIVALLSGTVLVVLGVAMFRQASMVAGGTTGIAFLVHYASHVNFGLALFLINLPFYWLAWRHMGREFTLKTFAAVALMSAEIELLPRVLSFSALNPLFAAVAGGLLIGTGMLILFRHRASIGGIGVVAVLLQERRGWRAGKVQMTIDCCIVGAALFIVPLPQVLLSVLGALTLNLVLAMNHRPGRYVAR